MNQNKFSFRLFGPCNRRETAGETKFTFICQISFLERDMSYFLIIIKDYYKAFKWYTKSANNGYSLGQNNLGICYEKGFGTNKDRNKAIEWYTKSANNHPNQLIMNVVKGK